MSDEISGSDIARSIKEYHEECEARLNAEIKRLQTDNKRLRERSWKISEDKRNIDMSRIEAEDALLYARRDVQRLRELLKRCQPYVEAGLSACDTQLCDAVEKEVGDE